jgi:hypothetical protein
MLRDSISSTTLFRVVNKTLLACQHLRPIFVYFVISAIYFLLEAVDRYILHFLISALTAKYFENVLTSFRVQIFNASLPVTLTDSSKYYFLTDDGLNIVMYIS